MSSGRNVFAAIESRGLRVGDTWLEPRGPLRVATAFSRPIESHEQRITVDVGDLVEPAELASTLTADEIYRTVELASGEQLDLRVDVIEPIEPTRGSVAKAALPVVVFVPGGGFLASPKESALDRRRWVAERGFVVVSVEYRTVRHGTYLDAVDDVCAAIDHACRRFDVREVALWGESAGGYLASMVAASREVPVNCVVNSFGLSDLANVAVDFDAAEEARHHTAEIPEAQFVLGWASGRTIDDDPDAVREANPVTHIDARCPPFLLFHGALDGLVSPSQTKVVHDALVASGVESERFVVDGAGHYGPEWSSRAVLKMIVSFLRRHAG